MLLEAIAWRSTAFEKQLLSRSNQTFPGAKPPLWLTPVENAEGVSIFEPTVGARAPYRLLALLPEVYMGLFQVAHRFFLLVT